MNRQEEQLWDDRNGHEHERDAGPMLCELHLCLSIYTPKEIAAVFELCKFYFYKAISIILTLVE